MAVDGGAATAGPAPRRRARCFWALCTPTATATLTFLYVDPEAHAALGPAGDLLASQPLLRAVSPSEHDKVQEQMRVLMQSRTLTGSVMRCTMASLSGLRTLLCGGSTHDYVPTDVTVNWIGPTLALCFFHVVDDAADACGVAAALFSQPEIERLWHTLYGRAGPVYSTEPRHMLQILTTDRPRRLLGSWPPPSVYDASSMAHLVAGAHSEPDATCTRRLRASHTLTTSGAARHVSSVVIPCGGVLLACFQVSDDVSPRSAAGTPGAEAAPASKASPSAKACASCGTTDSPEWRRGPTGHKTVRRATDLSCVMRVACGMRALWRTSAARPRTAR